MAWEESVSVVDALMASMTDDLQQDDPQLPQDYSILSTIQEDHVCQGLDGEEGHIDEMLRSLLATPGAGRTNLNQTHDTSRTNDLMSPDLDFMESPPKPPIRQKKKRVRTVPEPQVCRYCARVFARKSSLKEHIRSRHQAERTDAEEDLEFSCRHCDATFKHRRSLKRHLWNAHGNAKYECTNCWKNFSSASSLRVHVLTIHSKMVFRCGFCDKVFYASSTVRKHEQQMHPSEVGLDQSATERTYHYTECIDKTKLRDNTTPNVCQEIKCRWCSLVLTSGALYETHVKKYHASYPAENSDVDIEVDVDN